MGAVATGEVRSKSFFSNFFQMFKLTKKLKGYYITHIGTSPSCSNS